MQEQLFRPSNLLSLKSDPLQYCFLKTSKKMTLWAARYICHLKDTDAIIYVPKEVDQGFEICVTGAREIFRFTNGNHFEKIRIFNMPTKQIFTTEFVSRIYPFEQCMQNGFFENSSATFDNRSQSPYSLTTVSRLRFDELVGICEIIKECQHENSWRILNSELTI